MIKLPINLLLYVTSLGLAGGSGWLFYKATVGAEPGRDQAELGKLFKKHDDIGRARKADDRQDDYTAKWWEQFREVNLIGRLPPEPETTKTEVEVEAPRPTEVPLSSILRVECIVAGEQKDTRVVISYLPEANVTPPDTGFGTAAAPLDIVAGTRTTAGAPTELRQHMALDDALWAPHSHIRLVRIAADAASVFFLREDPKTKDPKNAKEEEVFKAVAELDQEVIKFLVEGTRNQAGAGADTSKPKPAPDAVSGDSRWQDIAQTKEVTRGEWVISRDDDAYIRDNTQRVLEDTGLETYIGSKVRGLRFTRVPDKLQQFGVIAGDVILEVNNVPVDTKAEAINIGKKQYNQGVRTFRVKLLSRGRVEERTFHAPDK